jgi:hypothetical protein
MSLLQPLPMKIKEFNMMKRIFSIQPLFVALSFSALVACQSAQTPGQTPAPTPSSTLPSPVASANTGANVSALFPNALSKRSLSPASFSEGQNAQGTVAPAAPESSSGAAAPRPAPGAVPAADAAAGKMIAPGYFGSPFDQVELKFVEELRFAAPEGTSLLSTYKQDMLPLVNSWDSTARLLMSAASEGQETYYLPNDKQEPEQVAVNFSFQWVSNAKKETLMIYVLDKEIRMHRMVWGPPNIDISQVKIDTADAITRAKKAFSDRSQDPGYPVYPESNSVDPNIRILYAIPEGASWDISLNEQQGKLRYFVSVNFKVNDAVSKRSDIYAGGFIEMDAMTGKIEQLNRPTWYAWDETSVGSTGPSLPPQPPEPVLMTPAEGAR